MTRMRRLDRVLALVLAVTAIAFWLLRILPAGKPASFGLVNYDLFTYYMPRTHYVASRLQNGNMPLWNPYEMAGLPLIATLQCGALYPLNLPYLVMPPGTAWFVTGLIHSALAGICMYAFCRMLRIGMFGATVAALTFLFCGWSLTSGQKLPDQFGATALMPLVFLCAEALLQRRSLTRCIWLGIAFTLLFLAGEPEIFVRTSMILGPYIACRLVPQLKGGREGWKSASVTIAAVAGAYLIFFGLAAAQWIPTRELAYLSTRAPGTLSRDYVEGIRRVSFSRRVLNLLPPGGSFETIGLAGLALLLLSPLCFRRRPTAIFFAAVAIIGFLLSLGSTTFLVYVYHRLPTGTWFRLPQRYLIFFVFAAAIAAAYAADHIEEVSQRGGRRKIVGRAPYCAAVLAVGVLLVCLTLNPTVHGLIDRATTGRWPPVIRDVSRYGLQTGRIIIAAFVLSSCVLLLSARQRVRYGAQIALCFLILFDTWRAPVTNMALPHHHYPQAMIGAPEVTAFVKSRAGTYRTYFTRTYRPYLNLGRPTHTIGLMNGLFALNGRDPLCPRRYAEFLRRIIAPPKLGISLPPMMGHERLWGNSPSIRLLDYLAVKYIVLAPKSRFFDAADSTGQGQPQIDTSRYRFVHQIGEKRIYENLNVLPRVHVVPNYKVISDPAQILGQLTSPHFDARDTVILEEEPELVQEIGTRGANGATATIRHYEPERVVIDVELGEPGFVVLSDLYFPGWRAFVNDAESRVYRANYMFRAVAVPSGKHTVTFLYRPRSFQVGAALSISTLIILLALGGGQFVYSRRCSGRAAA